MAKNTRPVGQHSRPDRWQKLDGRTREARQLRAVVADLTAHVGGSPSATEKLLIDRLARVYLRLALFDQKLEAGTFTDHDGRVYGALHTAIRLMTRQLGMKPAGAKPEDPMAALRAHIDSRRNQS
jgi:hypothetical protein